MLQFEKLGLADTGENEDDTSDLTDGGDVEARLFRAVMVENLSTLEKLFRHGANLNATNAGGYSPLGLATERGKRVACTWLAEHGGVVVRP